MASCIPRISTLPRLNAAETERVDGIISLLRSKMRRGQDGKMSVREVTFRPDDIRWICSKVRTLLCRSPTMLELPAPIRVAGDIHGQYGDLLSIFIENGDPAEDNPFLFLGDYVDRGKQSLECICLLFCFKLKFPNSLHLLRGNHECESLNNTYGFYEECIRRLGKPKLYKCFNDCFSMLPIAAVVAERVFCVHGGLSPHLRTIREINHRIRRPTDIPDNGLLCDLLWSDPSKNLIPGWSESSRGVSFCFGPDVIDAFLRRNQLDLICRAHQVVEDGYLFYHSRRLVTVFSAPNYCNEHANDGAVLKISEDLKVSFQITRASIPKEGARPLHLADRGLVRKNSGSGRRRFSATMNSLTKSRRERKSASTLD